MDIEKKVYGENGIYNKLKIIKSTNFKIKKSYNSVIPLNIYLTWGTKKLPKRMQENVDRMIIVNPEFNIQLYDDNDCRKFIQNNFSEDILIAFDTLKPGAYKADLWRLCILYINGGIYADIKLNCINNFKFIALTEKEHLVIDLPNAWKKRTIGLYNALMVSKPNNELLLRCINKISENVKNKYYDYNFLYPTGPGLLGEEYVKMLKKNELTIESELNKLDLCLEIYTENIIFNNVPILEHYKEYRTEQKFFGQTLHYAEIYDLKQIYNEIINCKCNCNSNSNSNSNCNCNCNTNTNTNTNTNASIFNIYNLILFCAIIITLLILYKLK
jgi:mannosyltransferase OCH1-like enzyme